MTRTETEQWLLPEIESMPVVDAHEHLPAESIRLREHTDALTFFRQYTRLVMFSAGLDEPTFMRMHDPNESLDDRFAIFEQYRDLIRHSGPVRAAYTALKHFYDADELSRDNFTEITARMRSLYQPGVYRRVLCDHCGITAVLQNADIEEIDFTDRLMRPVPMIWGYWNGFSELADRLINGEIAYKNPDEYIEAQSSHLQSLRDRGAVGFKSAAFPYREPDRMEAYERFSRLKDGDRENIRTDVPNPLISYLLDRLYDVAGRMGVPVAVHTGVWGDFRTVDCTDVIPYVMRHPRTRFDLFHMGMPSVRAFGRIGANFGNVWLNMCWAHTLSPTMAANALDEWLDQVAANKIIAFGGDVRWPIEKIYGHLSLAREVVATVLSRRIDRGMMSRDQALRLARMFLFDNPAELYGLQMAAKSRQAAGPH